MLNFNPTLLLSLIILLPVIVAVVSYKLRLSGWVLSLTMILGALLSAIFNIYVMYLFNALPVALPNASNAYQLYSSHVLSTIYGNFNLALSVEPIGALFIVMVSLLWFLTSIYSVGYMTFRNEKNVALFNLCLQLSVAATMGIALSANLLTMFAFYEMLTLTTLPLVIHSKTGNAIASAKIYLGYLLSTSTAFLLPAIIWIAFKENTLDFNIDGILSNFSNVEKTILATIIILGVGKVALFPFHRWLPAAMVAPTPASAILHAVAVVKSGALVVIKIVVYVFAFNDLSYGYFIIIIASITIITAGFIAVYADNLKAKLAYSTIENLAYIVLMAVLFTKYGIYAAIIQLVSHAFAKITLFFVSGYITTFTHHVNVSTMSGIARQLPIPIICFIIASISLIGMPVTFGFYAKFSMISAIVSSADGIFMWFLIAVLIVGSLLSALTYLPVIYTTCFKTPTDSHLVEQKTSFMMLLPAIITAGVCVILFFFGSWLTYLDFNLK